MAEPKGRLVTLVGFDPSGNPRAMEMDAANNLKMVIGDTSLSDLLTELQQKLETANLVFSSAGSLKVDGQTPSIFRPTPFGVSYSNLNLPAGISRQTIYSVPASQTCEIYNVVVRYIGTVAGVIMYLLFIIAGVAVIYNLVSPVVNAQFYPFSMNIKLSSPDTIAVDVQGATLNDNLYCWVAAARIV